MQRFARSDYLIATFWTGWRRGLAYAVCVAVIFALGGLRSATDAELAFASLAMLPVLVIAWLGGKWPGLSMAFLAAAMWNAADVYAGRIFSEQWIPWLNGLVRFLTYGLVVVLVAQVRSLYARERLNATLDALTGLLNRRAFVASGSRELERASRYAGHFSVVFMDLDNFKGINDTMGHAKGDTALQATATALMEATRTTDIVARMGGDEFAVILPEIDYQAAMAAAHKLFGAVNHALRDYPPARASVGVAWFEVADRDFATMLNDADELMYAVKSSGKNGILCKCFSKSPSL